MTITQEIIEQSEERCQQIADSAASFLSQSIALSHKDDEKSVAHKIDILRSFQELIVEHIDIESMPSREEKASYIRFLSTIIEHIEALEILIGRLTIEQIKAASQSFARKWEHPIGIYD